MTISAMVSTRETEGREHRALWAELQEALWEELQRGALGRASGYSKMRGNSAGGCQAEPIRSEVESSWLEGGCSHPAQESRVDSLSELQRLKDWGNSADSGAQRGLTESEVNCGG
jgi:hypothetical protein